MPQWLRFALQLLGASLVTVQITALASVLAVAVAMTAGLARLAPSWWIRIPAIIYIEVFRGTSLLVQLFWLFYVFPEFGLPLSPMVVAVLGLGLNSGAYGAEIVRGAIIAVPKGQYEAATVLNMSSAQRMWRVILPQAVVAMLPPWGNSLIELLKGTSLVSLITLTDLTFRAYSLVALTGRIIEIFAAVLLMYFLMSLVLTAFVRWLERRLTVGLDYGGIR